jgi:hypothetical protein
MLKEITIILGTIVCIFLVLPTYWVFYTSGPIGLGIPLLLVGIVLAYAVFHGIRLLDNNEGRLARDFLIFLICAIVLSSITIIEIFPYFASKFLPIS